MHPLWWLCLRLETAQNATWSSHHPVLGPPTSFSTFASAQPRARRRTRNPPTDRQSHRRCVVDFSKVIFSVEYYIIAGRELCRLACHLLDYTPLHTLCSSSVPLPGSTRETQLLTSADCTCQPERKTHKSGIGLKRKLLK